MSNEHRNGSAGGMGRSARVEEANRRLEDNQESRRHYRRVRGLLDLLIEVQGSAEGARGVDRSTLLRRFADAMREALPSFARQADLAMAEAIDMDRGRSAPPPPPSETSETKRSRSKREDSSPGYKRS